MHERYVRIETNNSLAYNKRKSISSETWISFFFQGTKINKCLYKDDDIQIQDTYVVAYKLLLVVFKVKSGKLQL